MPSAATNLLFRSVVFAAVTFSGTSAFALNAQGYLNIHREIADLGANSELSRAMLNRYLTGLSEAFSSIYIANASKIVLRGQDNICAPGVDAFTVELMEVAIQQQVGTFRNPKQLERIAINVPVGFHAMMGLAKLFPCK